ncbi:MAG: glutamate--tRNA ligase [Candidatus Omnitrophica bacterium]|nr:glutamate--tRNA ligase [Candidatus Omnitrophota bacterium]
MHPHPKTKVRFAPSPTGFLHIGGARTCLFNWLYARRMNGEFLLRIEDTDLSRSKQEYLEEILESIRWLGLDWDQLHHQSQRFEVYREHAQALLKEDRAFEKEGAVFFRYEFDEVRIRDHIRGEITFTELPRPEEVIIKSDGSPAYNFCCAVDDALMGITCVIRGEDHISNTPKQVLMCQAMGFTAPEYAHVPLILSPDGGRLSKRFGATSLREYRKQGYLPDALANYLLLLGWSPKNDQEIFSLDEARKIFELSAVNRTGAVFSLEKLNWMNGEYVRNKSLEDLTETLRRYLKERKQLPEASPEYFAQVVSLFRERLVTLAEFPEKARFCFSELDGYSPEAGEILRENRTPLLKDLRNTLAQLHDFSAEHIEAEFRKTVKAHGVKAKILVHPTRVALTGGKTGPGLFETMHVLGKTTVLNRIDDLLRYWGGEQTDD